MASAYPQMSQAVARPHGRLETAERKGLEMPKPKKPLKRKAKSPAASVEEVKFETAPKSPRQGKRRPKA